MGFVLDRESLQAVARKSASRKILDGRAVADEVLRQLAQYVETMPFEPKLAVVQVEGDPASSVYVKHKIRACKRVGIASTKVLLSNDTKPEQLQQTLESLNVDDTVHGILLQLPLPGHLDASAFIQMIDPGKDVDGLHPHNMGHLMAWSGDLEPCTPRGVMRLLDAYDIDTRGKNAVVVGRSQLVGRPMAQMLLRAHATTTICHRYTDDLPERVGQADLLIVATGVPELIKGEWVKRGAVVVDVGTSRGEDNKLVGDVAFKTAIERAALISPVPGGVGPMTVATLMENTVRAATRHL